MRLFVFVILLFFLFILATSSDAYPQGDFDSLFKKYDFNFDSLIRDYCKPVVEEYDEYNSEKWRFISSDNFYLEKGPEVIIMDYNSDVQTPAEEYEFGE